MLLDSQKQYFFPSAPSAASLRTQKSPAFCRKNWYSSGIAYPVQNYVAGKGDEPMRNVNLTRLKSIINHHDKYKEIAVPDGLRRPVRLKTGIFRELFEKNALPS